jgi:hypothetical protein
MEDDLDLVVFEDDEGNELTMEVLDYFFYEGQEYALLAEVQENCDACEDGCEECEAEREVVVMKVVPVGDDEEEFVPVDDELSAKLLEMFEGGLFDEDEEFDEENEEDDEDGEDDDEE